MTAELMIEHAEMTLSPSELRQAWLEKAVMAMRPMFEAKGCPVPEQVRVSMTVPSKRYWGLCYHSTASSDAHREIFIGANLNTSENVLTVLAHELAHAALPDETAHKKPWKDLVKAIGLLVEKNNHTPAGPAFKWFIGNFVNANGEYPAGAVSMEKNAGKQATAMIKVSCEECGYAARTTRKWLDTVGAPLCACNRQPMIEG